MSKIEFDVDLLITQYYAFRSSTEVAKLYGCSDQTILRVLHKNGIKPTEWKRPKREPNLKYAPLTNEKKAFIIAEYKRSGTIKDVAKATGHATGTISKLLYAEGVISREKKCPICGRVYFSRGDTQKWCSVSCRRKANDTDDRKRCRRYGVYYDGSFSREDVFERDGYICQICGIKCNPNDYGWGTNGATHPTIDHIIPLSKGGTHTWDNVQCACGLCNSRKQDNIDYAIS